MKLQKWLIRADGIGLFEVITTTDVSKSIAIAKAVKRVPLTATFHKLTAHKIKAQLREGRR